MNIENIVSCVILGDNFDYLLFKTAIHFAELGLNVWFISSQAFDKIPKNITPPEKAVSKLITFLYLKNYKDLLTHLNGIHLWHKIPNIILLTGFDKYCDLYSNHYNPLLGALVSATLLDSISVCAKKKHKTCYLIVTCLPPEDNHKGRLQVLQDMYFPRVITKLDDNQELFNDIVQYFK